MPRTHEKSMEEESMRMRFVFHLHQQKHAELCQFMGSLPPGMVSHHIRAALQQYFERDGFLAKDSAPVRRAPRTAVKKKNERQTSPTPQPPQTCVQPEPAHPASSAASPPAAPAPPAHSPLAHSEPQIGAAPPQPSPTAAPNQQPSAPEFSTDSPPNTASNERSPLLDLLDQF